MKKISFYLFFVVILGAGLVSFWAYQKYFKKEEPKFLIFSVERGNIKDMVSARGEVVNEKDFDLEFPFSGSVESVFVQEGQQVKQGQILMKIDTTDFELEINQIQEQLNQAKADLLIRQAEAQNSNTTLGIVTKQQDTFVETAYRTLLSEGLAAEPVDEEFDVTAPIITGQYGGPEGAYTFRIDKERISDPDFIMYAFGLEKTGPVDVKETGPTPLGSKGLFLTFPEDFSNYYDKTWSVVIPNTKSSVYSANLNIYHQALTERDRAIEAAKAELTDEGNSNLSVVDAKIIQAEASIKNYQAQIETIREKIKKSSLYAPASAEIDKIWLEKGESARPGQTAVSLGTTGHKIQTDISELEIVKVREVNGNEILVKFDAFPESSLKGKVVSIDPIEIIKDGDKYYRVNIYIEPTELKIRSGMSADLAILVSSKNDVLKIPEIVITKRDGKKFVILIEDGQQREIEVQTGLSDGESIEITQGLSEGQTVAVSAD